MINEKDLRAMSENELEELIEIMNEEIEKRKENEKQQIAEEINKLIQKADSLNMAFYSNDDWYYDVEVSLNSDGDLVFNFYS